MAHANVIEKNYDVLLRCTTINCYVIDFLKAESLLDQMQEAELRTITNPLKQRILLIEWLKEFPSEKYESFLQVMIDTEQKHVANLLRGSMEEDHLPLSNTRHDRLEKIRHKIAHVICIDSEVIADLRRSRAISRTDVDEIRAEKVEYAKISKLISAIMRRSNQCYDSFRDALRKTQQLAAAQFLSEGEMPVVHIKNNRPELDGTLSSLFNGFIINNGTGDSKTRDMLSEMKNIGLNPVKAQPGQSIVIFIYCKTVANGVKFTQLFNSGLLQYFLDGILNRLLLKIEPHNTEGLDSSISLEDEEEFTLEQFTGIEGWKARSLNRLNIFQNKCRYDAATQTNEDLFKWKIEDSACEIQNSSVNVVLSEEGALKEKGRNKELLVEQKNEIDIFKRENDKLKRELSEQKTISILLQDKIDKHTQELNAEKTISSSLQDKIDKLKQELSKEKTISISLQDKIDKHTQELSEEKTISISLEDKIDKHTQELNDEVWTNDNRVVESNSYKVTVKTLESSTENFWKELETTKGGSVYGDRYRNREGNQEPDSPFLRDFPRKLRYVTVQVSTETAFSPAERIMKFNKGIVSKNAKSLDTEAFGSLTESIRTEAAREGNKFISGLTILEMELFVISGNSSEVEAYSTSNFKLKRKWTLKELIKPLDIASCKTNACLYIMDRKCTDGSVSSEILKVDGQGLLNKTFATESDWGYGLSVTDECNVILTVHKKHKLNEYSPDGYLIREIQFSTDSNIFHPWHAKKLRCGDFFVSHGSRGDAEHRVCRVDAEGQIKCSFGGKVGQYVGQLNGPCYMATDEKENVFVADWNNRRVMLLDSELKLKMKHVVKTPKGLQDPRRIHLDGLTSRLFVTDNEYDNYTRTHNNCRILVFNVKDI